MEYEPCSSNRGVQDIPAFTVFQTPPDAAAMYQVLLSRGCTAMEEIRPEIMPGPMDRSFNPLNVADDQSSGGLSEFWARQQSGSSKEARNRMGRKTSISNRG